MTSKASLASSAEPCQSRSATGNDKVPFFTAAFVVVVLYSGNNMPSALYGVFRHAFGFSPLTQTMLYTAAVAVILPGLLVFGPLSDAVGRRLPMVAGLVSFALGDVLFATAQGVAWLYAGRLAQGLGVAAATAAAQATLTDTAVRDAAVSGRSGRAGAVARAQRKAAVTATACVTFGLAVGPLLGGVLGQYAPAPRQLAFLVHLALVLIAAVGAMRVQDGNATHGHVRLARVGVPPAIRRTFVVASASSFLAWAVLGVFSAVLPSLVGGLLHTTNLALTAGALVLMIAMSGFVQLVNRRIKPLAAQAWGLVALAVGLMFLVGAAFTAGTLLTVPAMLCTGVGHGLVYAGGLYEITVVSPPRDRGSVTATYYAVSYVGLGGPAIGVGLLALSGGLVAAIRLVAMVIAALCLLLLPLIVREGNRRSTAGAPTTAAQQE
ncbi:MFS transporter [Streptomyces gibsoniae]|uniref:MFS transporter n=1 Tax=Streptomyces gibsoniae TaxID=3075529 RepID=A0ABU2U1U7_9ACTN|nr:MFS transporter [Streptomyces sp. DSM 41699]MDT0467196.1 MFS transporter [Streptomyces sp. DSM 41699]